ncbi:hypothetical protein LBMAG21_07710 [Armatimonadota bacterium]|nr:hypothetical protein LBMAG21_07710 [Armatimonadota bacterium]
MKSFVYQLPTVMGTIAAMLVTLLSVMHETSPESCLVKTVAAFTVFAGLGMVLRYVFLSLEEEKEQKANHQLGSTFSTIPPGTPLSELLGEEENPSLEAEEPTAA